MKLLLLWDIDGTVLSNPQARPGQSLEEFHLAIERVTGLRELPEPEKLDGSTDFAIFNSILERSGYSPEERTRLYLPCLVALEEATTDEQHILESRKPITGVESVLRENRARGLIQTYCTGNSPARAQAKTAAFGLSSYLDPAIGGFGWTVSERHEFISDSISKARRSFGAVCPIVIGDTPSDIAGAKAVGARSVAVAGGVFSSRDLALCNPDLVLDDFSGDAFTAFIAGALQNLE